MAPRMHSVYSSKLFKMLRQEDEEVYQSVHHDQGFLSGGQEECSLRKCEILQASGLPGVLFR